MNNLKDASTSMNSSIVMLYLQAKDLLKEQRCNMSLTFQYIESFGLCFMVWEDINNRRLIHASVFFDLAEKNMLTIENIKSNSI